MFLILKKSEGNFDSENNKTLQKTWFGPVTYPVLTVSLLYLYTPLVRFKLIELISFAFRLEHSPPASPDEGHSKLIYNSSGTLGWTVHSQMALKSYIFSW